jgi:hypothetical protein
VPVDVDVVDPGARLCVVPWLQRLGLVHRLQTKLRTAATDLSVSSHDPQRAKHSGRCASWVLDSLTPIRSCNRASGLGAHQFHRPSTCMKAGSISVRTSVASASTARVNPTPNILMNDTCAVINAANEIDMTKAAAVTTRPVRASPKATLSSLSAGVFPDLSQYSRIRETRRTGIPMTVDDIRRDPIGLVARINGHIRPRLTG